MHLRGTGSVVDVVQGAAQLVPQASQHPGQRLCPPIHRIPCSGVLVGMGQLVLLHKVHVSAASGSKEAPHMGRA